MIEKPSNQVYTANQPLFLGGQVYMWNRYVNASHLVWMPDAQYTRGGHHNRVEILDQAGYPMWLTMPIKHTGERQEIRSCIPDDPVRAIKKIAGSIQATYGKYAAYKELKEDFHYLLDRIQKYAIDGAGMSQINQLVHNWVAWYLRVDPRQHSTVELFPQVRPTDPSEWVVAMGFAIDCNLYLGGEVAGKAYLKKEHFSGRSMSFVAQNYKMKPYKRLNGVTNGNANVSILDPLFVLGATRTRDLISVQAW
jgi:hypothetical protein